MAIYRGTSLQALSANAALGPTAGALQMPGVAAAAGHLGMPAVTAAMVGNVVPAVGTAAADATTKPEAQ